MRPPLQLGTETQYGTIVAFGWVGERYYWLVDKLGVQMLPADVVEAQDRGRPRADNSEQNRQT